jgi:hypothetical protein
MLPKHHHSLSAQMEPSGLITMLLMMSILLCGCLQRGSDGQAGSSQVRPATSGAPTATAGEPAKPVKPADFIRAESDRYFSSTALLAGGVNKFNFGRKMLALDEQSVVRMNRDTLYGGAVIDTQGGATITFPTIPDNRYASILLIDNDHYVADVIYAPGTYRVPNRTRYVLAAVRIHVHDPLDPEELAIVTRIQDQFVITASSAEPFSAPNWDGESLNRLRAEYEAEFIKFDRYPDDWMGKPGMVNEKTRHLAAAGGWGLFPNRDAMYINYKGEHPPGRGYEATYNVPENGAFWSITVYGADGFIKSDRATLNATNVQMNADGTFTVRFGSEQDCGDLPNRLDITPGWNFLMRVYKPGASILRGDYTLPKVMPLKRASSSTDAADSTEAIAEEAYVYLFPMVRNYQTIYQFAVDRTDTQYKAPFNHIRNSAEPTNYLDTAIQTVNSDTPYSLLMLDLRTEPIVVTMPRIESGRYYSLQIVDLFTHNVDYLGTRKDGNGGGEFLLAGPDWNGEVPAGITRLVRIPTHLAFSQFRTQMFSSEDLPQVRAVQAGYQARTLSTYLGKPAPPAAPAIDFPAISGASLQPRFWEYANFLLRYAPPLKHEAELRERFAQVGIGAGLPWPPPGAAAGQIAAMNAATVHTYAALDADARKLTTSVGLFGTPEAMISKFRERALGALAGIYGNDSEETVYPSYQRDVDGELLDTSKHNYTLTFQAGGLPPVDAFWSITMYDATTRLLIKNPLNRYLINSTMLDSLVRNDDGSITVYFQHKSPGKVHEANWLPAPSGPMSFVMRLYMPKPEVLNGRWTPPPVKIDSSAMP